MAGSAGIGDVVEVATPGGFCYLQFVGEIKLYGPFSILRVFDSRCDARRNIDAIADLKTAYYFASDVEVLLEDRRFNLIGHTDDIPRIPAFRHGFASIVENETARPIRGYSDGLQDMPNLVGVPAQVLVNRLATGWRPRDEFAALERSFDAHGKQLLRTGYFWITFETDDELKAAQKALELLGFSVSTVEFRHIKTKQLRAIIDLGSDLSKSRDEFYQAQEAASCIASQYNARKVDFLVE